jgi:exodeoxyribonuclease VIII
MTISNADYHSDPAISASHLHAVAASPYHYWKRFLDPKRPTVPPTAAMRLGSLVHCAVLEPDELHKRYAVAPDRRTKDGKALAAVMEAAGMEAVTAADMEQALAMAASVRANADAAALLKTGKAEQSFWWDDQLSGLRCKCRPDWTTNDTLVDLKTTTDASPAGFARSVAHWRYHVQADHYMAGTYARRFVFIAVEKAYPYAVGVYELDEATMDHAIELRRQNLQTIADCRAISEWPGYNAQTISLPKWALQSIDAVTSDDF